MVWGATTQFILNTSLVNNPVFRTEIHTGVNWAPILPLARILSYHKTVFLHRSILGVKEVTEWPWKSRFIWAGVLRFLPSCSNTNTPRSEVVVAVQTVLERLASKIAAFSSSVTAGHSVLTAFLLLMDKWCCRMHTSVVSEQPTQGNWIWMQSCEHFNPCVESDFCAFGWWCSLFVLCVTQCWVILLNLHYIFNKTILLLFCAHSASSLIVLGLH